jgi:transposase
MIQLTATTRIFIGIDAADFRCQIDGLAAICRHVFKQDPQSGALFVFRNRTRTALKILAYDGDAYWCCHRRLSKGRLKWWPEAHDGAAAASLDANALLVLIWNGDPRGVFDEPWKRLPTAERHEAEEGPRPEA